MKVLLGEGVSAQFVKMIAINQPQPVVDVKAYQNVYSLRHSGLSI